MMKRSRNMFRGVKKADNKIIDLLENYSSSKRIRGRF